MAWFEFEQGIWEKALPGGLGGSQMDVPVPASCLYKSSMHFWLQTRDAQHKCITMHGIANEVLFTRQRSTLGVVASAHLGLKQIRLCAHALALIC